MYVCTVYYFLLGWERVQASPSVQSFGALSHKLDINDNYSNVRMYIHIYVHTYYMVVDYCITH